ncbi:hypothetical protein JJB99_28185 [Bradyrhizobium diazoefficiens]|nr:hypothetical protein JJB99_28185 [Bradyrhizobium diazoefficiens]
MRQYGSDPYLPEPQNYLLPPMSVPKGIGWKPGETPTVTEGLKVQAMATGLTGTHFQFVPYRGAAPVMQDLIAGRLDVMFDQVSSALPHVRNGELKVYAVTAKKRLASAPEVPTVEEAGLPGLQISVWHALFAPKATPRPVIAKLNAAVVDALADPVVRERLESLGVQIPTREQQTPQALSDLQKAEIQKWWPILKAANVRAE